MAYEVSWYRENIVMGVRYFDDLLAEDIYQANAKVLEELEKAQDRIHVLVNVIHLGKLAFNFQEVMYNETVAKVSAHKKLGWVIYYDKKNPLYNFMASVVGQSYEERVRFYDTEAEAVAYLKKADERLEDDPSTS